MSNKILFYHNCYGDLSPWRDKYLMPVIEKAMWKLEKRFDVKKEFTAFTDNKAHVNEMIGKCFVDKCDMFFIPPDTMTTVESITNIVETFHDEPIHVAVPHLRVDRENYTPNGISTNLELAEYSVPRLHYSARMSDKTMKENVMYMGIILRRTNNFVSFSHCLPTVCYSSFSERDHAVGDRFRGNPGLWDNQLLTNIVAQKRLRVIGSSDFAVMFEMTKANQNIARVKTEKLGNIHTRGTDDLMTYVYNLRYAENN